MMKPLFKKYESKVKRNYSNLCIMCTHGTKTSHWTSRVAILRVWKSIIFHFIIPWFDQLENGAVSKKKERERETSQNAKLETYIKRIFFFLQTFLPHEEETLSLEYYIMTFRSGRKVILLMERTLSMAVHTCMYMHVYICVCVCDYTICLLDIYRYNVHHTWV